jgi:flagellin-like hook-associated protein FlgL
MTRIATTISGIEQYLLNHLASLDAAAAASALRMATGNQVNKPSDDPSAFLQISQMENRLGVVATTLEQVTAAANIGAQTQLAIDQIRTHMNTIRSALVEDEDQSLTSEERAANQVEIDAAIEQINSLASSEIEGKRLLDGSSDFTVTGLDRSQIRSLHLLSIRETEILGDVTTAAAQATLTYTGVDGKITDDATFTLSGARGGSSITVSTDDPLTDVADAINLVSHKTGVTASVNANDLTFTTVDYGANATISIDVNPGDVFTVTGGNGDGTAEGVDAVAVINGVAISSGNVDGNRVTFNQTGLHVIMEFEPGFTGRFSKLTLSDDNTPKFVLSEDVGDLASLSLPSLFAASFRGVSGSLDQLASGGSLAGLADNTSQAIRVIDEALGRLTIVEGQVDSFADVTVAASSAFLTDTQTSLTDSLEEINGVNDEEEALLLAEYETLSSNTLAYLALLRRQQSLVLEVLNDMAGFS